MNEQTGNTTPAEAQKLMQDAFMSKLMQCKRCNHEWIGRINPLPKCCPACKNYKWQTSKK